MGLRYQKGDLTMLDAKDLELLRNMIGEVVEEKVNPKFEAIDQRLDAVDRRLDAVDRRFEAVDQRFETLESKIDQRFEAFEAKMEARIHESENMLLDELDRVQKHLGERIDKVQANMDEMNQYYRITKLENDNTSLLLRLVHSLINRVDELEPLKKRVEALESKIA